MKKDDAADRVDLVPNASRRRFVRKLLGGIGVAAGAMVVGFGRENAGAVCGSCSNLKCVKHTCYGANNPSQKDYYACCSVATGFCSGYCTSLVSGGCTGGPYQYCI